MRKYESFRCLGIIIIIVSALIVMPQVAQCGMSFEKVLKTLEGLSKEQRLARVEEEARKEGRVVWTSGRDLARLAPFLEAWKKKYPDVQMEYRRSSGRVVADRVLREYLAGKFEVDVISPSAVTFAGAKDAEIIRPYFSPESEAIKSDMKDPDGFWVTATSNPFAIYCNTDRVKTNPKDWKDFTQPKWKGDFSIDTDRIPWFYAFRKLYGDDGAKKLISDYMKNGALLRRGGTLQAQLVAAGAYSCALGQYLHSAVLVKEQGGPIDYILPEPILLNPSIYLMARIPPHPYAAILLYDYLVSVEGMSPDTRANAVYPSRGDVPITPEIEALKGKSLYVIDAEGQSRNYNESLEMYRSLIGGG